MLIRNDEDARGSRGEELGGSFLEFEDEVDEVLQNYDYFGCDMKNNTPSIFYVWFLYVRENKRKVELYSHFFNYLYSILGLYFPC